MLWFARASLGLAGFLGKILIAIKKLFSSIIFPDFRYMHTGTWFMYIIQWRTHGGRWGPSLKILKEMKTSLETNRLFSYKHGRNCSHIFLCYPTCNKILSNFHCDAIISLPVIKLFWCAALNVDNCRKSETFLF